MRLEEPGIARTRSIGIEQAHVTLRNATRFLGSGLGPTGLGPIGGRYRAKVIGNGLRELDRFLSVLLDEVALVLGWEEDDLWRLAGLRNTANKLGLVYDRLGLATNDLPRLRALGRCRDCLFHCGGVVRRGDVRHAPVMTVGWPEDTRGNGRGMMVALGDRLPVELPDLAWICGLYNRIAGDLVEDARRTWCDDVSVKMRRAG